MHQVRQLSRALSYLAVDIGRPEPKDQPRAPPRRESQLSGTRINLWSRLHVFEIHKDRWQFKRRPLGRIRLHRSDGRHACHDRSDNRIMQRVQIDLCVSVHPPTS
jgi:hypothetical protein